MDPFAELLGESAPVMALRAKLEQLLRAQSSNRRLPPILIEGETGTGKGLLARCIHRAGPRRDGPFVDINCAAIPETLLEAELFGYERGAFTDARRSKPGLFQLAHRGTIFLDEVALLPDALQAKLLSVLEERSVRRLGGTEKQPIDVSIISATNIDVVAAVRLRRFREDLYHRLAVFRLMLPPLRERGDDVLLLAEHILSRACVDHELPAKTLSPEARARLLRYRWPGNVRELANTIERIALVSEGTTVTDAHIDLQSLEPASAPARGRKRAGSLDDVMREHLEAVLAQTSGNISRTAEILGITRNTLRARMDKYGVRASHGGVTASAARRDSVSADPVLPPSKIVAVGPEVTTGEGAAHFPAPFRWERRLTTMLSVALSESPDASLARLTPTLQELIAKVRGFGGVVDELTPFGLVAVFGGEPMEDGPTRAVHAARASLKAVEHVRVETGSDLAARAAIHTAACLITQGAQISGMDPDDRRRARDTLSALLARAEGNTIVASEAGAPFLERRFELLAPQVVGAGLNVRVVGSDRTGFEVGGRLLSPFVGRGAELLTLQNVLATVEAGHGQIVGLAGEPGVGKSRLLYEFREHLPLERVTYLEGRCLAYATAVPYLPIMTILRTGLGITEVERADIARSQLVVGLKALDMDPGDSVPQLVHLLGLTTATEGPGALDPEAIKTRTFEALRRLCVVGSRQRAVVIAIEDLHWIDRTSEESVSALVDVLAGHRILLLVTYRPGYQPRWLGSSYASQIALAPLNRADSHRVVHSVAAASPISTELADVLVDRAEGIPFFLEELARAVVEHASQGTAPVVVPDTVQGVLAARLDRLPAETRDLLQISAVVGKDVPTPVLQSVAGLSTMALRSGLADLHAAEFLRRSEISPVETYTFKHALTHEVAYESLPAGRRRELHASIVRTMEALYADRLEPHVEGLARHAMRGELWEKAVQYLRQAGSRAFARSANRESVTFLEGALTALRRLPESRQTLEEAIDIRFALRNSLQLLGDLDQVIEYLRQAEELVIRLGDSRRLGWWLTYMGHYSWITGRSIEALDFSERATLTADETDDVTLEIVANLHCGLASMTSGDHRRADVALRTVVRRLQGERVRERFGQVSFPAVAARSYLVFSLAERGEFEEGIRLGEEGLRLAETLDHPYSLGLISSNVAYLYTVKGDLDRALVLIEHSDALSRQGRFVLSSPRTTWFLGRVHLQAGRLDAGVDLLERAALAFETVGMRSFQSLVSVHLGEAYLQAGRPNEARTLAERAIRAAGDRNQRSHTAYALRLLGDIAASSQTADVAGADRHYRDALALADQLGMRPLAARCHVELALLHRRAGRAEEADSELDTAATMFRAMDMRSWLATVDAARSQVNPASPSRGARG